MHEVEVQTGMIDGNELISGLLWRFELDSANFSQRLVERCKLRDCVEG